MKAVILAGGMGIRLRPFTFSIPKPLLPVGERPVLEIIIRRLKKYGFSDFILAVGYKSKMIEAYFGNGRALGVHIKYIREKESSGTAGPLVLVKKKFRVRDGESVLLMNGDILTKLDFVKMRRFHQRHNYDITMGVKRVYERQPYGLIDLVDGCVKKVSEKPEADFIVNCGIYFIKGCVVRYVPRGRFYTMPELINRLASEGRRVGAYNIREFWLGLEQLRHFEEVYNNKSVLRGLDGS